MRILCLAFALGTMMSLQLTPTEAHVGQANLTVDGAIKSLTDPNPKTRWQGARALREMGERAEASVPVLVKAIERDASIDVQVEAILALGAISKGSTEAVVSLTNILPKRDRVLSVWAVYALGDSGPRAKDAVPAVVTFLESATEGDMVIVAIVTLGRIGPAARQAIPAIEKHLRDTRVVPEWGEVAHEARKAIGLIQKIARRE